MSTGAQCLRFPVVLLSVLCGCATTSIPRISLVNGADRVTIVKYGGSLDPSCVLAGTKEVSDGRFGRDRAAYVGTWERADDAVRNAAVAANANVALIIDVYTPVVLDSPGLRGYELGQTVDLYRCDSTVGVRQPQPPPLAPFPSFEPQ
jgi:hypothetical protein